MSEIVSIQITRKQKLILANGLLAHGENLARRIGFAILNPESESLSMERLKEKYQEINDLIEILQNEK